MKMSGRGFVYTVGKAIAPIAGQLVAIFHLAGGIELVSAYLNLIIGKGSGSGWDKGEQVVAANLLKAGNISEPTIIDCGGNVGEWTREVRVNLGSDRGRWVVIEPQPACIERLRLLPNVEIVEAGAGERASDMVLYSDAETSGTASLHDRADSFMRGRTKTAIQVPIVTIDSIVADKKLDRVDFMKMDIEGHELFALKGAKQSLSSGVIKALSFEFGSGNVNSRTFFRDFWDFLTPLGFQIYRIIPGGRVVRINAYYEDLEFFRGVSNYIAVHSNLQIGSF
jgi:FkbM family methyltransferase